MNARVIGLRLRGLSGAAAALGLIGLLLVIPVLLPNAAGAQAGIAAPPAAAAVSVISGAISYSGVVTGTHLVWVGAFLTLEGGPPAYAVTRSGPGPYSLDLPAGTYYLMAGMDADDSAGAPDPAIDPLGVYAHNPLVVAEGAAVSDVDIDLRDPGSQPEGGSISGQIGYAGRIAGTHNTIIVAVREGEQQPAYSTVIQGLGPYTIAGMDDGSYMLFAFMDLAGDMGPPQPDEPAGWYDPNRDGAPDVVTIAEGNAVTGIDIILRDPLRYVFLPLAAKRYHRSAP